MSKELSDTDLVNSEPDNSVYYVNNVHSKSDTDKNCKGKSKLQNTNHMHDSKNNSLECTSQSTSDNIISANYVNTVMDNTTNIGTIEQEHFHKLTPKTKTVTHIT